MYTSALNISTIFGLAIALLVAQTADAQKATVEKTQAGFTFMRNGQPYYVKGVGGDVNLDKAVKIGANSIRTWGIDNAQTVLDEAQKRNMTVMLGMWLQPERQGFDYDDKEKVEKQLVFYKSIVDKYKNHPALLMWGIGNELDLQYTNPNCWNAVQDIAKYIHEVDKNHPTSTVTSGLDSLEVQYIKQRAPDIDIYCVNTYGDISNVPKNIERFGWSGAYMITEWGVNGYWESPNTAWSVSIEQTSTEKKQVFYDRYTNYIAPYGKCLGSYAFLWGEKQEYTETWFGLFSKDNKPTEPIDALEMVFLNKNPEQASPTVEAMLLNDKKAADNIKIKAASRNNSATITAKIATNMLETQPDAAQKLRYEWKILAESADKKSGGDAEEAAQEMGGLIRGSRKKEIVFDAPTEAGAYRLFATVYLNDKIAYANIPFWVDKRTEADGQANWVEFKKASINKQEEE